MYSFSHSVKCFKFSTLKHKSCACDMHRFALDAVACILIAQFAPVQDFIPNWHANIHTSIVVSPTVPARKSPFVTFIPIPGANGHW